MADLEPHHQAAKTETDALSVNRKGITFTWRGLSAWAIALAGITFSSAGVVHGMLYGQGPDLAPMLKEHADKQESNAKRISALEADAKTDRALSDERQQRVRDDLAEIKAAVNQIRDRLSSDHFSQGQVK